MMPTQVIAADNQLAEGSETEGLKASPSKRRKSSRIGSVLRKLLGRKSVKSQISSPTPATEVERGPTDFITSGADGRFLRALSLPPHHVSRDSALGSHAPATNPAQEGAVGKESDPTEPRPPRARRASMPGAYGPTPEPMGDQAPADGNIDESNIGFAVTSGSHPRRRSRSYNALYDANRAHRMSPIQWRQLKRRSDEIRYWRDSIGLLEPMLDPQIVDDLNAARQEQDDEAADAQSVADDAVRTAEEEEEEDDEGASAEYIGADRHQTFDFGVLASSMNEQEQTSLEERVVTVEVKLMDLEYAISKLQSRTPTPLSANTAATAKVTRTTRTTTPPPPRPGQLNPSSRATSSSRLQTPIQEPRRSPSAAKSAKSEPGTASTTSGTVSTQMTANSLSTIPNNNNTNNNGDSGDPFVIKTAAAAAAAPSPTVAHRQSITTLTIDHYATLIGLLRREQSARIRLEEQVAELQRDLFRFMYPPPPPSSGGASGSNNGNGGGSLYRARRWDGSSKEVRAAGEYAGTRRMPSFDADAHTSTTSTTSSSNGSGGSDSEAYEDVYESAAEANRNRRVYEGPVWHGREGEAF